MQLMDGMQSVSSSGPFSVWPAEGWVHPSIHLTYKIKRWSATCKFSNARLFDRLKMHIRTLNAMNYRLTDSLRHIPDPAPLSPRGPAAST